MAHHFQDPFEHIWHYCDTAQQKIKAHVLNDVVLHLRVARLERECIKGGLDAFYGSRETWNEESVRSQAFKEEFLGPRFLTVTGNTSEQESALHKRLEKIIRFFNHSKQVLENGGQADEVKLIWDKAFKYSDLICAIYDPWKKVDIPSQLARESARFKNLGLESRIKRGNHDENDVRELASVAYQLYRILGVESEYQRFLSSEGRKESIENARRGIEGCIREVDEMRKKIEAERKAKEQKADDGSRKNERTGKFMGKLIKRSGHSRGHGD